MDYEFRFDPINQQTIALFSMGHEVVGYWLNEEVQGSVTILNLIDLEAKKIYQTENQWQLTGKEFSLLLSQEEVMIRANDLDFSHDEIDEGMSYYDEESLAFCGLDDFLIMLGKYRQFLSGR